MGSREWARAEMSEYISHDSSTAKPLGVVENHTCDEPVNLDSEVTACHSTILGSISENE